MSDPIDRDSACKTLMDDCHIRVMSGNNWIRLEEAVSKLCDLPSAQLEIIRCRDCKHYDPYDSGKAFYCFKGIDGCYPDDFCSHAERRTDE